MAISYLCTVQDVRNMDEYISTSVRDDGRVMQCIWKGDSIIRAGLRDFYTMDTSLLETAPYAGPALLPFAMPDISPAIAANAGTGALGDITVNSNAVTEVITITFSSSTAFSVSGSSTGAMGTGATNTPFSATGSQIAIPAAKWSGTPANGDRFYVSVYLHKPLIVMVSTMFATGILLRAAYQGAETSSKGTQLYNEAKELLKRMQRPYADDGLTLDTFSPRDITPEGVQYVVDVLGYDVSKYADNEMTNSDDSTDGGGNSLFGFFYGPVWGV